MLVTFDATVLCGAFVTPHGLRARLLGAAANGLFDAFITELVGMEFVAAAASGVLGAPPDAEELDAFLDQFDPLMRPSSIRRSPVGRAIITDPQVYGLPIGESIFNLTGKHADQLLAGLPGQVRVLVGEFDPEDLHVAAAAIEHGADVICTDNTRDFTMEAIGPARILTSPALAAAVEL